MKNKHLNAHFTYKLDDIYVDGLGFAIWVPSLDMERKLTSIVRRRLFR